MSKFVKMVVNNLSYINNRAFLDLRFISQIKLHSGSVNITQISDVVFAVQNNDYKLRIHQLFVIWNLVMIWFTFSYFEDCAISFEVELNVFELVSVRSNKLHG